MCGAPGSEARGWKVGAFPYLSGGRDPSGLPGLSEYVDDEPLCTSNKGCALWPQAMKQVMVRDSCDEERGSNFLISAGIEVRARVL